MKRFPSEVQIQEYLKNPEASPFLGLKILLLRTSYITWWALVSFLRPRGQVPGTNHLEHFWGIKPHRHLLPMNRLPDVRVLPGALISPKSTCWGYPGLALTMWTTSLLNCFLVTFQTFLLRGISAHFLLAFDLTLLLSGYPGLALTMWTTISTRASILTQIGLVQGKCCPIFPCSLCDF